LTVSDDYPVTSTTYREPVLTWTTVPGATSYVVQLSPNSDYTNNITLAQEVAVARLALPQTLPHGSYFWRVRSKSTGGLSAWADGTQFGRAWVTQPSGLAVDPTTMAMTWSTVPGASFYQVEISKGGFAALYPYQITEPDDAVDCFTNHT